MITFAQPISSVPIPEVAAAPLVVTHPPADSITRDQMAARVALCRSCQFSAKQPAACEACDIRCAHPNARPGEQIIARGESTCPGNLWPVLE